MKTLPIKYKEIAGLVKERIETGNGIVCEDMRRFAESLESVAPTENARKVAAKRYFRRDDKGNICEDWPGMLERVAQDIATEAEQKNRRNPGFCFLQAYGCGLFFRTVPRL